MVFRVEERYHLDNRASLEEDELERVKIEEKKRKTIERWMVDSTGVIVDFPNTRMLFVGGRVLGKSAA